MPPWALDGGYQALFKRLRDPAERAKIKTAMMTPAARLGEPLPGRRLARARAARRFQEREAQATHGQDARRGRQDARHRSVRHDPRPRPRRRVARRRRLLSDVGRQHQEAAARGRGCRSDRTRRRWRPRASSSSRRPTRAPTATSRGCSASTSVQDSVMSIEEAIRRVTSLPAANLELTDRGQLEAGLFADVVVFDPGQVGDRATFETPHQLAVGVSPRLRQRRAGVESRRAHRAVRRARAARSRRASPDEALDRRSCASFPPITRSSACSTRSRVSCSCCSGSCSSC